jgi:hypothetical protein
VELQEIEVIIGKNGQVQISVSGVNGPACLEITAPLEEALGGQVVAREMKSEAGVQAQQTLTTTTKARVRRKR